MSNLEQVQTSLSKKDESTSLSVYDIMMRKKWLLKRLIDLASEHVLLIKVFTSFKHQWNQHRATIILVFHYYG